MKKPLKIIISGGGTGGHIFPAIAIANAIKEKYADADILFVGAENRMEMTRVPAAGYKIIGLEVAGFNRSNLLKNFSVLLKLFKSLQKAKSIVKSFKPDIAIGVGGYASGPLLKAASKQKIPTLIQEQNSYAGVTNKLLAKKATTICVAYDKMDQFFPKEKIVITGNPCRQDLISIIDKTIAYSYFNLDSDKKTILIIGGSLGARTINESIFSNLDLIKKNSDVQILWQCGSRYKAEIESKLKKEENVSNIHCYDFIDNMNYAYAVADLVISRAGASSISELCLLGKPSILVPSPNVAEDHQTKNAQALVDKDAAILVKDEDAPKDLMNTAFKVLNNKDEIAKLSVNIKSLAYPDATNKIVEQIEKIVL